MTTPEMSRIHWDHSAAFVLEVRVEQEDIDHLQHANNAAYLRWLERCAWAHSASVGLDWAEYQRLGIAFVVHRHELDYLAATYLGQRLAVATWVTSNDGRLALWRGFQIVRLEDSVTVLRAASRYVSIKLETGRPCRMPREFRQGYVVSGDAG